MEMDIGIAPYKAFENPLDYLRFAECVTKKGTVSREFNCIFCYVADKAEEKGFTPSEDRNLGDFAFEELGLTELKGFVRNIITMAGQVYFDEGIYPIIYTRDKEGMPIDITTEEVKEHDEKK